MENKKVVEVVKSYMKSDKLLDGNYLMDIASEIAFSSEYAGYVDSVTFENKAANDTRLAYYRIPIDENEPRVITMYLNNIENYLNTKLNIKQLDLMYKKFYVIQILLHELEHARQNKLMDSNFDNLESLIIKNSEERYELRKILDEGKKDLAYFKNRRFMYDYCKYSYPFLRPTERLAEINSYEKISELAEKVMTQKMYADFFDSLAQIEKRAAYKSIDITKTCPTTYYMSCLRTDALQTMPWYDENYNRSLKISQGMYDLDTRLRYGLPISKEEMSPRNDDDKPLELLELIKKK